METVKIALIQQPATKDKQANIRKGLESAIDAAKSGANVIAFAELAFEWFYPQNPAGSDAIELAETIPGPVTDAFADIAKEYGVVVVLNLFERDGNKSYDTSPVIDADGTILGSTRMIHITEYECFHEQGYYEPGDLGIPVFETKFGKIGVAICYDRHYPEYMRTLALNGAEIVFVPQAGSVGEWPDGLYHAEMQVAAFQNGYFTALCNRVGPEERLNFGGESFVCDPGGKVIAAAGEGTTEILYCDLDLNLVAQSHAKKLFLRDRRPDLYAQWLAR